MKNKNLPMEFKNIFPDAPQFLLNPLVSETILDMTVEAIKQQAKVSIFIFIVSTRINATSNSIQ